MNAPAKSPWNPPQARLVAEGDPDAPLYAGFWRRWAAAFLDGILYYIVAFLVGLAAGSGWVSNILVIALAWLYHALMQSSSKQATLGKMAFGIKVTSLGGERISFLRATGRYFATILSSLLLMIGYLMAAFTQRKQALHDMIAGTLVVRNDAEPEEVVSGGGTMKITGGVIACGVVLGFIPVLGILAAIAIPAYSDYTVRAKMTEAVAMGSAARASVQEYYQKNGRLPRTLEEAGVSTTPSQLAGPARLAVRGDTVTIAVPALLPQAQGGSVIHSSSASRPGEWRCGTDRIPHKYLPAACRNAP